VELFLNGLFACLVVYFNCLKRAMPISMHVGLIQGKPIGSLLAWLNFNQIHTKSMTKSLEVITEAVRNPKPPFRKLDSQPKKEQKHRYERRKVREYLQLGDWASGESS